MVSHNSVTIALPGAKQATVGAFNGLTAGGVTIHGDQVAAYTTTGAGVTVPTGYVGYVVPSTILRTTLRGVKGGFTFAFDALMNVNPTPVVPTPEPAPGPTG